MWIEAKGRGSFINLAQAGELLVEQFHGEWDVVAEFKTPNLAAGKVTIKTCETEAEADQYREMLVSAMNRINLVTVPGRRPATSIP